MPKKASAMSAQALKDLPPPSARQMTDSSVPKPFIASTRRRAASSAGDWKNAAQRA